MRTLKRINEFFLYFAVIVSGYLIFSLWYYISRLVSIELNGVSQVFIGVINTFILALMLSLMVYLIIRLMRRFY